MKLNSLFTSAAAILLAIGATAQSCQPSHGVGEDCFTVNDGALYCDNTCSEIVSCLSRT